MWWLQKPYNLRDHKQCARSRQRWHLFRSDFKVPHQHISHFVLLLLLLCFTQFDISLNGKCVLIVMISLFLYFPSVLCIHSIAKLANECNCFVLHTVGCVTGASQSCPDSHKTTKRTRISIKKCFLFCILFSGSFCLFCTFYSTYWFRKWSCSIWHRCPHPTIRKCDVQRRRANRQHNNKQRSSAPSLISLLHLDHYCHIIHCVNSTSKWVFSASINKTQRKTQDDERTKETSLKAICNLFKRILFM